MPYIVAFDDNSAHGFGTTDRDRHRGVTFLDPSPTADVFVEAQGAKVVLIDGYRLSIRGEDDDSLHREIGAPCRYLRSRGVTTLLVDSSETVTGEFRATHGGVGYIADNILFLRYLEVHGELRKAIGVLKKRTSDHERALREFRITEYGLSVGAPLRSLRGILEGTPEIVVDGDVWDERA